jgi:hypothetical protein
VAALAVVCLATALLGGTATAAQQVPASQYVDGVCTALFSWQGDLQQHNNDFQSGLSSDSTASDVKDQMVMFLDHMVASTKSMVSDVRDAGVPHIKQGSGIATSLRNATSKIETGFEDALARAQAVPIDDLTRFESQAKSISTALNKTAQSAKNVLSSAKKKYDMTALEAAAKKTSTCKGVIS